MIQNAQLDNEKSAIAYQVELYKDKYLDLEAAYSVLQVSGLELVPETLDASKKLLKNCNTRRSLPEGDCG